MDISDVLRKVPFFASLPDQELGNLAGMGKQVTVEADTPVFREGDDSDSMYIVVSGEVRIFKVGEDGSQIDLIRLGQGDFFGELALLDNQPRSATALALTPCQLFVLDQAAFIALVETARSQVVFPMFSALTRRVRETSEKYLREELEKQALENEMELEKLRAITQMVAGVAHEINTPLGIIATAASIIDKTLALPGLAAAGEGDRKLRRAIEDAREAIGLLLKNVERAHRLTQDFKKVSASQITDTKEPFNLLDGVKETLNLFSINARKANIEIKVFDRLEGHDPTWLGYRGYLSQLLMNFLTNVERYAYPDGAGGKVEIIVEAADEPAPVFILIVRDYGKGIPPENLARVFEPFFTTGRMKGGTGLGMAIAHNIVTSALKGTISIDSTVGEGTTVQVVFPQSIPDPV